MIIINYCLSLLLTFLLISRLRKYEDVLSPLVRCECKYPAIRKPFRKIIKHAAGFDLFAESASAHILQKQLKYKEHRDPYQSIQESVLWISEQSEPAELTQFKILIRALYQLQHSLSLPDDVVEPCISSVADDLKRISLFGEAIDEVQMIKPGEHVNLKSMQPVNNGSAVSQPLGVAILVKGKVIVKAQVICN
ncbi:MAG: hypothetical protein GY749_12420 [Desulfobacteraceae bacterium]|nr:hypothetical protein [Desulfobacteraceae bacterium]